MHREQFYILLHPVMKVTEERHELLKVLAYQLLLIAIFLEQTVLDNICHFLFSDGEVHVAVLHLEEHLGCKLEFFCLVNKFLHTKHEPHPAFRTLLAKGLQDLKVMVQHTTVSVVLQVRKHLVNNDEEALLRVFLIEKRHHIVQLLSIHLRRLQIELVINAIRIDEALNVERHHLPERPVSLHLKAQSKELACNGLENLFCLWVRDCVKVRLIFCHKRDQ